MIPSKSEHIVQSRVRYLQYDIERWSPLKITNWYSATFYLRVLKLLLNKEKCKISFVILPKISTFVAESWQSGRMRRS